MSLEWIKTFWLRVKALLHRQQLDRDLQGELQFHLGMREQKLVRSGMPAEEARYAARRRFGNTTKIKEANREMWTFSFLETLWQDIRYGLRQLRRNPGFSIIAVLVLALGMGVAVAIFGFVDAALLEPLPYANPGRLMSVNESNAESRRWPLSYPDYLDWQRLNKSFSSLAVYSGAGYLLRTASGAEPVQGQRISGGFFQTLGVHPILGRDFHPGEDRPGGPNVVLLSYGAWVHRFAAERNAVGRTVDLDDKAYTIIGVLPRAFSFAPAGNVEFWTPINSLSPHEQKRTFYNFWGIGRLRDGVTLRAAQAEMAALASQLQRQYAVSGRNLGANIVPFSEIVVGDVRPILEMLLSGAGLLLLIACVDVAGLVLARAESRRHEIAVRGALGATTLRLAHQFVTEGLLLAGLGSLAGLLIAGNTMKLLGHMVPKDMAAGMPFLEGVGLNAHTGAFAIVIALIAALLLAASPTVRFWFQRWRNGVGGLAEGDRGTASLFWRRVGANLVVVELTIAVVLLAGAGLLGKSLYRLLHVQVGFDPNHLATVQVMAPGTAYNSNEQMVGLYRELLRRVSGLPGAESAGLTSMLPVQCNCPKDFIGFPGRPLNGKHNEVDERHVSADYLPTLKARLVRGRLFTESEDASRPGVVVINQALARRYFPGQDPVGQRIADDEFGSPHTWQIVGVIEDVREGPLDVNPRPAEYFPINQTADNYFEVAVRTRQDAKALLPELASMLHQLDPSLGVTGENTMNAQIDSTQAALLHRFSSWLVGGFALMAVVLGVVGLYGVIAYSVSRRTREIGIRIALGAQRTSVYGMVLKEAGRLTAIGISFGLLCSAGAAMLMRGLLFGIQPWDAATLAAVAVVISLFSLLAAYFPAHRAAQVDPIVALRYE
jgi:macrolide transport system ATP-binding/permease protein